MSTGQVSLSPEQALAVVLGWLRHDHDLDHRTDRCPEAASSMKDGRCWDNCKTCDGRGSLPTPFSECRAPRCVFVRALSDPNIRGQEEK